MATQQQILDALNAAALLITNNAQLNETQRATLQAQADAYVAGAKSKAPFIRTSRNQMLTQSGGVNTAPDGWAVSASVTVTLAEAVPSSVAAWSDYSPLAQEFLTAMGLANTTKVQGGFNIIQLDWANLGWLMYQSLGRSVACSVGCIGKLVSGTISSGSWLDGVTGTAGVCGTPVSFPAPSSSMFNAHPVASSVTGTVLIALPAILLGDHPFDTWGAFPRPDVLGGISYND